MYFSRLLLSTVGLLAASTAALPTTDAIPARQLTSPSIISSVGFELDDVVQTNAKVTINVDKIFKEAKSNGELAVITAGKVQKQAATLIYAFVKASWAIEGDLNDAIRRIGFEEAARIRNTSEKFVKLAKDMAEHAKQVGEKEDKAILTLLKNEGSAIASSFRAMFSPLETFVHTAQEDAGSPGALKEAKKDMAAASATVNAYLAKLGGKA